ncbi:hypothetical protein GOBAR_AA12840 [Gossypium barbadense]|uniref:CCHC-type domain-containing protein n=1 Tax=Gossypium barbadense TaxID=3634 RepID=A0A2P5XWX1_GOSBA|nr:hypothetical protein GOBAR_AA12840 [Gossypium barbadense]
MENSLKVIEGDDNLRSYEDCNTKKIKFKDGSDGVSMDMAMDFISSSSMPWTKDFSPLQPYPSVVMAWIRLPGLPGFMFKRKILEAIGSMIGKVAKFDFKTDNRTKRRFARMAVFINLDKSLVSQIQVNGDIQRVEYESLPTICFTCGKYGHVREMCSLSKETSGKKGDKLVADDNSSRDNNKLGKESDPAFGPWLVVERRSHRRLGDSRESGGKVVGKGRLGSRFDALTTKGKRVSGEKEMIKADDLISPISRYEEAIKSLPNLNNESAKRLGLDSVTQKKAIDLAVGRIGGGGHSSQGTDRIRLKSLGKMVIEDDGSNGSLVGPIFKTNPSGLCSQVCLAEVNHFVLCESLNLGVRVVSIMGLWGSWKA